MDLTASSEGDSSLALLGMLAGSADADTLSEMDSDADPDETGDDDAECIVRAGDDLLETMSREVARINRETLSQHDQDLKKCPLCPFRCLHHWKYWQHHIGAHNQCC